MQEHKLSVIFEPSYTLDALNFLDHLFIPRSLPNEQMVCYFEEYLGDYHEKILQNIRKNLIKFESGLSSNPKKSANTSSGATS